MSGEININISSLRNRRVDQSANQPDRRDGDDHSVRSQALLPRGMSSLLATNLVAFTCFTWTYGISFLYMFGENNNPYSDLKFDTEKYQLLNEALSDGVQYGAISMGLTALSYLSYFVKNKSIPGGKTFKIADLSQKILGTLGTLSSGYGIYLLSPVASRAGSRMNTL